MDIKRKKFAAHDDWDWTRPKDEMTAPAFDNKGRVIPDYVQQWGRRFQDIWKQDRRQPNRGDVFVEGDPDTSSFGDGSPLVNPDKIQGAWDPSSDPYDQVYDSPNEREEGGNWYDEGSRDAVFNIGGHFNEIITTQAGRRNGMEKKALLKQIVRVADYLDSNGMYREADVMDGIMVKVAQGTFENIGRKIDDTGKKIKDVLSPYETATRKSEENIVDMGKRTNWLRQQREKKELINDDNLKKIFQYFSNMFISMKKCYKNSDAVDFFFKRDIDLEDQWYKTLGSDLMAELGKIGLTAWNFSDKNYPHLHITRKKLDDNLTYF